MSEQTIYYFGDSLTDNGSLPVLFDGLLDPAVFEGYLGPTGALSDGPTYATTTADLLGAAEVNYAVSSAKAVGEDRLRDVVIRSYLWGDLLVPIWDPQLDDNINLAGQIDRFLADTAGADLSGDLAVVKIGINDLNGIPLSGPNLEDRVAASMEEVVAATEAAVASLLAQGMGAVWVSDIPAKSYFPFAAGFDDGRDALVDLAYAVHRAGLHEMVAGFQAAGHDVSYLPLSTVTEAIAEDPTGFGFFAPYGETQIETAVLDLFDADQVAFWDSIHPSAATHAILGAYTAGVIEGGATALGSAAGETLAVEPGGFGFGLAGDDSLIGRDAALFGGSGGDRLIGGLGRETLSGGTGDDRLVGGAADDILAGGTGNDWAFAGDGDDVLLDSLGDDHLLGGDGDDSFVFTEAVLLGGTENGQNRVFGGAGTDRLILVLSDSSYAAVAPVLGGVGEAAALATLGIWAYGMEEVFALNGRGALETLSQAPWYDAAEMWNLL